MVPLRIVIITKTDPLKKSLPKFAQPGAGCPGLLDFPVFKYDLVEHNLHVINIKTQSIHIVLKADIYHILVC